MTDIQRLDTFLHRLRTVIFNPTCISAASLRDLKLELRNLKLELMEALADFKKSELSIRMKVDNYDQVNQKANERLIEIHDLQALLHKTGDLGSVSTVKEEPK